MKRIAAICAVLLIGIGASAGAQSIQANPAPGSFAHNIVVSFPAPPPDESLYYSVAVVGAGQGDPPLEQYTSPLVLTALPGELRSYSVTTELRKGNAVVQSDLSVWKIDRRTAPAEPATSSTTPTSTPTPPPTSIPVLSPAPGTYANQQLFFVNAAEFRWVRYTTDGTDPAEHGRTYSGPTLLSNTGDVELRVAALGKGAAQPLTATVRYGVKPPASEAPIKAKSGLYDSAIQIAPPASGVFHYDFRERSPESSDPILDKALVIGAPPSSVQYTELRLRSLRGGEWGPEYRYFFAVDRRTAPKPILSLLGGGIATPRTKIRIEAARFTRVYYTTDGSTPTRSSTLYSGEFAPELPADSKGTLTVKAKAFAPNGSSSEVAAAEFPFTTIPPRAPAVTIERGPELRILVQAPQGTVPVYERSLDGNPPPDPTRNSPRAQPEMLLTLPRGASLPFSFKFASIDATGAVSPPSKLIQVTVDQLPPAEPTVSFVDGRLAIASHAKILYNLTRNGYPPQSLGTDPASYSEAIPLSGKANERTVYYLAAQAVAENGQRSAVVHGGPYVVDRRIPAAPVYWGVSPGDIYNTDRTLRVGDGVGEQLLYTLSTDGTTPGDPTLGSSRITGPVPFSVPKGSEKSFVLKLRTRIGEKLGPVVTVPFRIDKALPSIPPIAALSDSGPYNHSVTIDPPKIPLGETLYISFSSSGQAGDPLGSAGRPFETPIQLTAPNGEEREFEIRLAARDAAGNTNEDPNRYRVTIDRRIPETPQIVADPSGGTAVGRVQVTLTGSASTYRYELTDNGSDPSQPTRNSKEYSSPLLLEPKNGAETIYSLSAIAESSAGNLSAPSPVYRVLVEPKAASRPTPPAQSPPANQSAPAPKERQLLIGADNGGLYNTARTLHAAPGVGIVRYEIDSNGEAPPPVTLFSPVFAKSISINTATGETRSYEIRAAAFTSSDSSTPVAKQLLQFTIDRTPPPAPSISGLTDNARYQQPATFTLHALTGTIYYSLDKLTPFISAGSLSSTQFTPYTGPVRIGVGEASARYRIHAYTVDKAGNRSARTREWTVYFDRGVVYASPNGSDSNDGTSVEPVKSLSRALELAQTKGRNTIFLASGRYTLAAVHDVSAGLSILGDFDPADWHQKNDSAKPTTFVSTSPELTAGGALFSVQGGGLSLERLELTDERPSGTLFRVINGALSISDGSVLSTQSPDPTIVTRGGTISLDHVSVENQGGGSVLSTAGTTVNVSGSAFAAGPTSGDSIVVALADGSQGSIKDSQIHPSSGLRSIALSVAGSKLEIQKSQLIAGSSTRQSIALFAENAEVGVTGSKLVGSALSHLSFGIQSQDSQLRIAGTTIEATGSVGATGIWADKSSVNLTGSKIVGSATSEFLYLLKLTDSHALVSSDILIGADSGDYLGVSLTRSPTRLVGNTFYGGQGTGRSSAVSLIASSDSFIVDNIFARSSPGPGEAIRSDGSLPTIVANDFAGYTTLLAAPDLPNGLRSVDALNAYSEGGKIRKNVSEPLDSTLRSLSSFELKTGSACIGGGVDPSSYGADMVDYSGITRSAPFDIGALRHR